jgi:ribosomal protein L10
MALVPIPTIPPVPKVDPNASLAERRAFLNTLQPLLPRLDDHGFSHHAYLYPGIEHRPVLPRRIRPSRNIPVEDALGSEFTTIKVEPLPKIRRRFPRSKPFPLEKQYYVSKCAELFARSNFLLCFQHNMSPPEIAAFKTAVERGSQNRLLVTPVLKTGLVRHSLEFMNDKKFAALAPIFRGPTSIVHSTDIPMSLDDLHMLLSQKVDLFYLGGIVEHQVVHHQDIQTIASATSMLSIQSGLISTLQTPYLNLVRALKNPLDMLVRVLQAAEKSHDSSSTNDPSVEPSAPAKASVA